MQLAKVWNRNTYDFTQDYKGQKIHIPAGKYIEMEYFEAKAFASFPYPMKKTAQGVDDPTHFKMIDIEGSPGLDHKVVAYKSMVDGSIHATEEAMYEHNKRFAHLATPTEEAARAKKSNRPRED